MRQFDAYEKGRRDDLIDLKVPTDLEGSHVDGRNGMFHIQQLYIWESVDHTHVYLEGIGKRGYAIRGGLLVSIECFAESCRQFLRERELKKTRENLAQIGPAVAERERIPEGDPKTVFEEWKMRCPQCCSDEGIEIQADVWVRLHHDGTTTDDTQDGGHEWSAQSPAQCRRCDFSGTVLDFEIVVDDEERSNGPKKG
jgi:hypothetical protein